MVVPHISRQLLEALEHLAELHASVARPSEPPPICRAVVDHMGAPDVPAALPPPVRDRAAATAPEPSRHMASTSWAEPALSEQGSWSTHRWTADRPGGLVTIWRQSASRAEHS